ncbi:SMI1/KNR4 family protein [Flavobacterium cerinum]|uniref:SMI1/KNR4 family protein n=1 Tax=Flavobacterium cerinum TaxID=2502784 RepID=A0A3S4T1P7_9FLAO|nr:SMI1/KNR4 family protein [Flavobacterium cerinum]RWX00586.1 SMI1/KNR4 family protein [Flavobacterium cerinum]
MKLLTIEKLLEFLNTEFKDVDPEMVDDLLLKGNDADEKNVNSLMDELEIEKLPKDFVDLICKYDFGNFSIQNVQFGYEDNYFEKLEELNSKDQYWYNDIKKRNLIVIGLGDPFTALLSPDNGAVYGVSPEISFGTEIKIADSFTHFIRGLGSAFYAKRNNVRNEFLEFAEEEFGAAGLQFWKYAI